MARTISAFIDRSGNKQWGDGVARSQKLREGLYIIEFEQPLSNYPVVTATVFGSEWQTFNLSAAVVDVSPHHVVYVTSSPDHPQDCGTMVIIVGE